jgi:penicillin amidase
VGRRIVQVTLALVPPIALALGGALLWWSRCGRPQRDGEARVAGLGERCTVRFDGFGVPHVSAASARDLACALGWLHANDRMGQMELARRRAAGRLSELVGERALDADREMRRLRLRRAAERCLGALAPESRALLDAYAAGVNAWLDERGGDLPPDLILLRAAPEPWTAADSLSVMALMWHMLAYSAWREEQRFEWLVALGPDATRDLLGERGREFDSEVIELALHAREERERRETDDRERAPGGGSNNWAVAAERTRDGHALVANDPHLSIAIPGIWYEAQLRAPDYEAAGVTLPGLPMVVIGQGPECAWGFTNTELDVCDLAFERGDPPRAVERNGALVPTAREVETIRVRGGGALEIALYETDVGPLLEAEGDLPARSLRWAAYTPFDPIAPFAALARARSQREVDAAVARYVGPSQNVAGATRADGIFFAVMGKVPEREGYDGRMPAAAWTERARWSGWREYERNPRASQPECGLVATANHDPRISAAYDIPYRGDFATPHRVRRILDVVGARGDWEVESLAAVQTDLASLFAGEVLDACSAAAPALGDARWWAALGAWDRAMELEGPSALYACFERELRGAVFGDELEQAGASRPVLPDSDRMLLAALRGELALDWIDDVRTPERETLAQIVARAGSRAWQTCVERWGEDPARWRWGELHRWRPAHPLASAPILGRYFARGPFGVPGSATTIRVFSGGWNGGGFDVVHGASVRFVADVVEPDRSRIALPVGQSGHAFDAHFDDQIELYLAGGTRAIAWSEDAIESAASSRLVLTPE